MFTVLTPPVQTRLATLAQVEAELGLDGSAEPVLGPLLDDASAVVATYCRRTFGAQQLQEKLAGTSSQMMGLVGAPIVSVSEVDEDDNAITDYVIGDAVEGVLERDLGWYPSRGTGWGGLWGGYGGSWGTAAYTSGYLWPGWKRYRYTATYWAGYLLPVEPGDTPPDGSDAWPALPLSIVRATVQTVKTWYLRRKDFPISSKRVDDVAVTYDAALPSDDLAPGVKALLNQYRRGPL